MINYKNEHVWQSYDENDCKPNSVSDFDAENMNTIFVRDQAGEKFESSRPETAELNLSFDSIDCGVAYFMKSDSVPYLMSNVIGSNYKEDNGRIQLGEFPVQFELTQNTGNCQLGHGTYKITTLFKFDRPTYKNKEAGYTIEYDSEEEQWKMCPDSESGDESCCISDVVTGPYEEITIPTPTPTPDVTPPGIPVPTTDSPTTNKRPTWTWNAVAGNPVSYDVRLNGGSITNQTGRTFTPSSDLSDGSHTIEVRAKDALGNTSAWGSHIVTIDATAPGKPQPNTTTPTTDRTPTWTWNAVSGNPVSYDVQLNNGSITNQTGRTYTPSSNLSDGSHTIKVRAKDALGNTSDWGTHTVTIDTTAPGKPNPTTTTPTNDRTPTWTWNAVSGNPVSYDVQLNNGSITNQTGRTYTPSSNLSDGSHTIKVRAKDALGNTSDWGTHTVTIDATAPGIPNPDTETPTQNRKPTWEWNKPSGDPVSYDVRINGGSITNQTSLNFTPSFNLSDGSHTIEVRAIDQAGNISGWGSDTVTIDTTAPDIPIPITDTPTQNRKPTWTWDAVSGNPVSYDVQLNSGSITNQTTLNFTPSSDLSDGSHTIKVRAKDALGNTSAWGTHTVTIDNIPPPMPNMFADVSPCMAQVQTPTYRWTGPSMPHHYHIRYKIEAPGTTEEYTETLHGASSFTFDTVPDGYTVYFQVCTVDNAGNKSAYRSKSYTVDLSAGPEAVVEFERSPTYNVRPSVTWCSPETYNVWSHNILGYEIGWLTTSGELDYHSVRNGEDCAYGSYKVPHTLYPNRDYDVYVRAVDKNSCRGPWTKFTMFTD